LTTAVSEKSSRSDTIVLYAVVAIGIAIRINQYVRRPALWLDEAMLSLSIVKRSWRALIFSPLEFSQSAPPFYLQFAHFCTVVFGRNELALRLPAILFSIASMVLFAIIARRVFQNGSAAVAAGFFALSPMLVRYSAEAKPYAADIFVATLMLAIAIKLRDSRFAMRWILAAIVAIGVSVFVADVGVIVVGGVGIGLAFLAWRERDEAGLRLVKILAPITIFVGLFAVWGAKRRMGGGLGNMLHSAWSRSFWPILPPHSLADVVWPAYITSKMYEQIVGVRAVMGLTVALAVWGVVCLWRRGNRDLAVLIFWPFLMGLLASVLRLYPFSAARVGAYLTPALVIALTAGIDYLAMRRPALRNAVRPVLFVLFLAPEPFVLQGTPPLWLIEDIPSVLQHVQANRQSGDRIYAYWAAVPATYYYAPQYGLTEKDIHKGEIWEPDIAHYAGEIDPLIGSSRAWLIFSHDRNPDQRDAILAHADSLGRRIEQFPAKPARPDAVVYLYDFSGSPGRDTSRTSAQTPVAGGYRP
jgi:hypothetical protein